MGPAVMLGQDLADVAGPVREGGVAELASATGRWATVTVVFSRLILDGGPMLAARGRRARFGDTWRAAMAEHGWGAGRAERHVHPPRSPGRPRAAHNRGLPTGILTRSPNRRTWRRRRP
jgi:hypothetical protein